ncbi:hypothetical protein B9G54_01895 [Alloscardovia macacae]|uniref:Single-stranded-DNA-specific exonuclease RecJ n=1 Tax=Alloscardovia macacae TaxID=1160091 RepID=A0A1Y2SVV6_9BIFI|nr:DHH family phosphoesterase [Alloscardovia macacae]OTA27296.1 hypothetical protein B9G54_01895 [Alloscardovia macacae]OTA29306.1 hypothetical protein B9T39_04090 [Alloscardovia macacae]
MTTPQLHTPQPQNPQPHSPLSPLALLRERAGLTDEYLTDINTAYAAQLDGMDAFLEKLHHLAANEHKTVTISPDFDMDGITSGTILYAGLSQLGLDVHIHIPDYTYGHEFCPEDVDDILAEFPDTEVILTCDSGVNSVDGIRHAQSKGLQVLVTDHHEQEVDCPADAMLDPCAFDSTYPLRGICGAAVALLVVTAYARRYSKPAQCRFLNLLQLFAGLGTISDVMPLVHDNRFLVRRSLHLTRVLLTDEHALDAMRADPHTHPAFLTAFEGYGQFLRALSVRPDYVNESFYGFTVAPMFNAPRRVGTDLADAFLIFLSSDASVRAACIERLQAANAQRKADVERYLSDLDTTYAPYVYITDAPQGMLGLLAGRLKSESSLPTAVVHVKDGMVEGSMRSPEYFPLIEKLGEREDLSFVGHQLACGVRGSLSTLVDALSGVTAPEEILHPQPALRIGYEGDVQWWDVPALSEVTDFLDSLAPFGKGFEYPLLELTVPEDADVRKLGAEGQHLKVQAPGCPPVLMWNTEELTERAFSVQLSYNEFRGQKTLQMVAR